MPQSHAQVWLHIVFSTKERRGFLQKESFRDQMFRMLAHYVKKCGCASESVGGHVDHVRLLVGLSRTIAIADLIEHVKTETPKWAEVSEGTALFPMTERLWSIFRKPLNEGQSGRVHLEPGTTLREEFLLG